MLSIAVFFPILAGLFFLLRKEGSARLRRGSILTVVLLTSAYVVYCLVTGQGKGETLFPVAPGMPVAFRLDGLASLFCAMVAFLWPLSTLYGFEYMQDKEGQHVFFSVYTICYGVTLGIALAGNLVTLYIFYELLTLVTLPLVTYGSSGEAWYAGKRYMMYCFSGAAFAFVGLMLLAGEGSMDFVPGGFVKGMQGMHLQAAFLCCLVGFGVKAAIWPFHAWLPTAAVAPTPVTALLHAVAVVKAGVFCILRVTYFCFGASVLEGGLGQKTGILLASVTIVYASVCAVREHHFKRRLAWSTVSNLSYIILAAMMLSPAGMLAGMAHMLFHALIKITLFFCCGAVLEYTGRTQVEELKGLGKIMPRTTLVYTVAALALSGTPLLPGFISKWLIGTSLVAGPVPYAWIGLASILVSAVLTAVYVLTPAFFMLFRGEDTEKNVRETGWRMALPLGLLTLAIVLCGLFSNDIIRVLTDIAAAAQ